MSQALVGGDLPQRTRKQYLRHLRKLCGSFGILPSSFFIESTFDKRGTTPFAFGGFADVYDASFGERRVAVKTFRVNGARARAHRVRRPPPPGRLRKSDPRPSSWLRRSLGGNGSITRTFYHLSVSQWRLRFFRSYQNGWRMEISHTLPGPIQITIVCVL